MFQNSESAMKTNFSATVASVLIKAKDASEVVKSGLVALMVLICWIAVSILILNYYKIWSHKPGRLEI